MPYPLLAGTALLGLASPRAAHSGGYDTPILYTARHQGMGGTAIGHVDDASAVFHNPAGLARVRAGSLLGDFSLLTAHITSSPGSPDLPRGDGSYRSRESERIVAPLFLLGAAYRIATPVTVGLGVYPVASASAEYRAQNVLGRATVDRTRLVFIEASPAVAVRLRHNLGLALGYRVTLATLERVKGDAERPQEFDFSLRGVSWDGLRAGVQWQPNDHVALGVVYRHKIAPTLHADNAYAYADLTDAETTLVLPSKAGFGASGRWSRVLAALDLEYGFYSQNDRTTLRGFNPSLNKTEQVTNRFAWKDAVTVRAGTEYSFGADRQIAARAGYVFDGQVGNKAYPSAFGTPPTASHSVTVGGGYRRGGFALNLAAAYRVAATSVAPSDVAGSESCATCSKPGPEYNLAMLGLYLDFSFAFDAAPLFGS